MGQAALLTYFSRLVGLTFTSSARPALTFFLTQLAVVLLWHFEAIVVKESLAFLVSTPAIAAGAVAAVVEHLLQTSDEAEEVLRELHLDKVFAAAGAFATSLLLVAVGAPQSGAVAAGVPADLVPAAGAGIAAGSAGGSYVDVATASGSVIGASVVGAGLAWLRAQLLDWLEDVALKGVWQQLEAGGVLAALLLLLLAPVLVLGLVVLATALLALAAVLIHFGRFARDQARRRPCAGCNTMIRQEASLCFKCRAPVARAAAPSFPAADGGVASKATAAV